MTRLTERLQHAYADASRNAAKPCQNWRNPAVFYGIAMPKTSTRKARKALREDGIKRLSELREALDGADSWTIEALQGVLDAYCAAHTLSMGQVGPPLRAALTGGLPAPDLAPVMYWLGRDEVLARIEKHYACHGRVRERKIARGLR